MELGERIREHNGVVNPFVPAFNKIYEISAPLVLFQRATWPIKSQGLRLVRKSEQTFSNIHAILCIGDH